MTRTSVIEVGDEIVNPWGEKQVVTGVNKGTYGLMVYTESPAHSMGCWRYMPFELPPDDSYDSDPWMNWRHRAVDTLPSGQRVGSVTMTRLDPKSLEYHEAHWLRTIDAMPPEELQSRPTDIRMDS